MEKHEFLSLVDKYLQGQASEAEEQLLINYYSSFQGNNEWVEELMGNNQSMERGILEKLQMAIAENQRPVRQIFGWKKWVAAASIAMLAGLGSYWLFFNKPKQNEIAKTDVPVSRELTAPFANRAVITLSNGQKIFLDSTPNGTLTTIGNVQLVKLADGRIAYNGSANDIIHNTLSNPRGSKVIDMTLADGSRVWLNAGSSITYPVAFADRERRVTITGEAYFEVSHDASKPFYVGTGETSVQVLGTHFNVNAYDDETEIKVTLLEGSVRVSKANKSGLLKPGQQAQVGSGIKLINDANIEQVMAWKNGKFDFGEGTDLRNIMKQIARWYDVNVEYEGNIDQEFWGTMSRQEKVSDVLEKFELTGRVHFQIDGRKIIVRP